MTRLRDILDAESSAVLLILAAFLLAVLS